MAGERAAGGARASSGAGEAGGFCTEACGVGRLLCSGTVTSCRAEDVCRALRTEADGGRRGEGNPRGWGPIHQVRGAERETRGAGRDCP